jgi:O-antigen/teichoic acid export membrane protein
VIRDLVRDLAKYLPAQIAPAIMGFIAIPIVTRLFPPADYGNYALVISTVSILAVIVGWLSMSIIRFHPVYERGGRLEEFHSSVVKLLFISVFALATIFLGILFVAKSHVPAQLWHLMLVGTLFFVLTSSFQVLQSFLRARRQVSWYSGFSVWYSVAALGVGLALIMVFHYGVEGLLWGNVLSLVIAIPLLWMVVLRGRNTLRAKGISAELTKDMAKYGFPLVVGNLAAWILSLSDRYVIELYRGSQEVGIYSASYAVSQNSIMLLASLFIFAAGPLSMNIWEREGKEKSQEFVTKVTRYYLLLCLPAVVGLSVVAKPAIGVLAAPEYHLGYRIVAVVVFGAFFLGLQQMFQLGLIFYKKTGHVMIAVVISGLLNLGLNFWLVPQYGYMAAAVTTLVSYAFLLVAMIVISRRYFVWDFPFKSLGKIAVASTIMGAVVYPVGNGLTSSTLVNLILGICVGAVVYPLMLFLLREFQRQELQELQRIGTRIAGRIWQ